MTTKKPFTTINKLAGTEDFQDWKFSMKMLLKKEKLFHLTSKSPNPDIPSEIEKDEEALATICLHIEPQVFPFVRQASTAKEAWENLIKTYESKSINRRIKLLDAFLDERLENHDSMQEYIAAVMNHAHKLGDIDKAIDDDLIAVVLLRGLPEKYNSMRMALQHSGTRLTSEVVKTELLQEEGSTSKVSDPDAAFGVRKNKGTVNTDRSGRQQSGATSTNKKMKCFSCGKRGHRKIDCPDRQGQSGSKPKCFNTLLGVELFGSDDFYLDSGASCHLTFREEWCRDLSSNENGSVITCANNEKVRISGVGNILARLNGEEFMIKDVKLVPGLQANLLSVSKIVEKGNLVVFESAGCSVYDEKDCRISGTPVATASKVAGIYKLDNCKPVVDSALAVQVEKSAVMLWHRRLGHVNFQDMRRVPGMEFIDVNKLAPCEACLKGKMHKLPFDKNHEAVRATAKLELVHMDLCGPMETKSYGGHSYFMIIVDDFTRKLFIYFLKSKTEVFDRFKKFVTESETYSGMKVKIIRSDNGKEFVNSEFNAYLESKGIMHQLSVPYTPEQNSVAERSIRTVTEMARSMLADAGLNTKYWAEACQNAVYTKNRLPHSANGGAIPEKLWSGRDVDMKFLKVFGSRAFMHVPKEQRKKWDYKGKEYIFVGYCDETKGYRFSDPNIPSRVVRARDVVFIEEERERKSKQVVTKQNVSKGPSHPTKNDSSKVKPQVKEDNPVVWEEVYLPKAEMEKPLENEPLEIFEDAVGLPSKTSGCDIDSESENDCVEPIPETSGDAVDASADTEVELNQTDHSLRSGEPVYNPDFAYLVPDEKEPSTIHEARSRVDKDLWEEAIKKELDSMREYHVWELVEKPPRAKVVGNKWVFKYKQDVEGVTTYKAR